MLVGAGVLGTALAAWQAGDVVLVFRVEPAVAVAAVTGAALLVTATVRTVRILLDRARAGATAVAAREHRVFLRRLDHELKNPLTAILIALANLASTEPAAVAVSSQVSRLSRIVVDLRKLAEISDGPMERVPVDLAEILRAAAATCVDRQVSVTVPEVPWPLPTVPGDQDLLDLAVHNLVDNAVKYSRPGSRIALRVFEQDHHVVVEIADTGRGINAEEIDSVWAELARGRDTAGIPGSGLGLALVRVVTHRHGGTCDLRSRPGEGTVVRVRLPV
ncbi:hypothetical protein Lfu02_01650 [Longispora fulva]|nr:hypothetical protein Lfu02_01650 [Longispora fulva]